MMVLLVLGTVALFVFIFEKFLSHSTHKANQTNNPRKPRREIVIVDVTPV